MNNELLPFVNIAIQGTTTGASSDENGKYKITGLKPGLYNIAASFVGFENKIIYEVEVTNSKPTVVNIEMSETVTKLKHFNYKNIYSHPDLQRYDKFCDNIISTLFDYLMNLIEKNQKDYWKYHESGIEFDKNFGDYLAGMHDFSTSVNDTDKQIVTDYISGMTDTFALESIKQITIPKPIHFN